MSITAANLNDIRKMVLGMDYKNLSAGIPELSAAPVNGANASKKFGTTNSVTLTAKDDAAGDAGNDYSFAMVDPEANSEDLAVALADGVVTVTLATDGSGSITSTPALIKAALEADDDIDALFDVTTTGTAAVAAGAEAALTGGVDCTQGTHGICGWKDAYLYLAVADYDAPDDTIWRRVSIGSAY